VSGDSKPESNPEPRRSPRRDFLKGKSALDAIDDLADRLAPPDSGPPDRLGRSTDEFVLQFSRPAMACEFEISLNPREHAGGPSVAVEALDLVDHLEDQLSVYRDGSEVSRINRTAFDRPIQVEWRLFRLFQQAKLISSETAGAFDITTGALSKVWGFYRRQGRMPSPDEVMQALVGVGFQHLELDETRRTIRFLHAGCELNLGAIGKGYALDRCAETLRLAETPDFLVHGGNSSVLAGGSRSGRPKEHPGWLIGLRHPLRPEQRLAEFLLHNQALGTSGSGTQYFHHQGKRYAHIIDPRSGWPADKVLSATAIAPKASQADALSTAFYVLGVEGTKDYCAAHPDVSALFTLPAKVAGDVELIAINLPDDKWQVT
jgi:thiamine biosynthesis lipoprotein